MAMSRSEHNVQVMLEIFSAIEQRDPERVDVQRQIKLFHLDVEFVWPPPLPYGGTHRGLSREGSNWADTWNSFQPTEGERKMDPRVVAATDSEVVILWRQRGIGPTGVRIDTEVLALYELRDGKLARGQMFYFDPIAVTRFLADAKSYALR